MLALPIRAEQTCAEVVRCASPQLSVVNAGTGSTLTSEAVIAKLLLNLMEYFGVTWSKTQATECAHLWATEYYWMSAAEIKHFLSRCKTGQYSKDDYRHLSPFQLFGWLSEYANELLQERRAFADERESVERWVNEKARLSAPDMMFFDAVAALAQLGERPAKSAAEQEREDAIFRINRDRAVQAYETVMLVTPFVDRLIAREQFTEPEDLQFYQNHKETIENELIRRKS